MKRRSSRVGEAGYSLVEALVAITLFVVVASITGTLIVQAHKTTRRATSAAFTQSQLQDTVLRVAREVVVSDPITVALPTQLETVTVRGVATVRTRFWYKELDASNHTGEIRSISAATLPAEEITVGYKVIARNVTDRPTAPQGGTPKILAYVDGNSRPVGDGVHALSASELPKVARVKINLNAILKDRSRPLTLVTSMATRLGSPAGWGPPLAVPDPTCPAYSVTRDITQTVATLTWDSAPFGVTGFKVDRGPVNWLTGTKTLAPSATTLADPGLVPTAAYRYSLQVVSSGPPLICSLDVPAMPPPPTPLLQAWPASYNNNDLTWSLPAGAALVDHYKVFRSDSPGGALTDLTPTNLAGDRLTYTDPTAPLGLTKYYKVAAYTTTDLTPTASSLENPALQFPAVPVMAGFVKGGTGTSSGSSALNDDATGTNHVAWSASAGSTGGYNVYWNQGTSAATLSGRSATLTWDEVRSRGSRFSYWAVGVNACHDPSELADPLRATTQCLSGNKPGGTVAPVPVAVYQRPRQPEPTVYVGPDRTAYPNLATNFTRLLFTHNGDAGNPAGDKFCNEVTCTITMAKKVNGATTWDYAAGKTENYTDLAADDAVAVDPDLSDDDASVDWGATFEWSFQTCNDGGCSTYSVSDVTLTYPGKFGVTHASFGSGYKMNYAQNLTWVKVDYRAGLTWSAAAGFAVGYSYEKYDGSADSVYSPSMSYATLQVQTPGREYDNAIHARAANGLIRTLNYRTQSAPGTVKSISGRIQCETNRWRMNWEGTDTHVTGGQPADSSYYQHTHGTTVLGTEADPLAIPDGDAYWTPVPPGSIAGASPGPNNDWPRDDNSNWVSKAMTNSAGQSSTITLQNYSNMNDPVNGSPQVQAVSNWSTSIMHRTMKSDSNVFGGTCNTSLWKNIDNTGGVNGNYQPLNVAPEKWPIWQHMVNP